MLAALGRSFRTAALDLLYPPGCAACDAPIDDVSFCAPCRATLLELDNPCPRCALPYRGACIGCVGGALDATRAAYAFGGALADAIRLLKFASRTDLGAQLAPLVVPHLRELASMLRAPIVLPVPLSTARLRERGYNQAALLAHAAARATCLTTRVDLLARTRDTPPQSKLAASQRRSMLTGAFVAHPAVMKRDVILLDDVMTTGATLSSCALALRLAGASRVVALTVGRALP